MTENFQVFSGKYATLVLEFEIFRRKFTPTYFSFLLKNDPIILSYRNHPFKGGLGIRKRRFKTFVCFTGLCSSIGDESNALIYLHLLFCPVTFMHKWHWTLSVYGQPCRIVGVKPFDGKKKANIKSLTVLFCGYLAELSCSRYLTCPPYVLFGFLTWMSFYLHISHTPTFIIDRCKICVTQPHLCKPSITTADVCRGSSDD